MNHRHRKVLNQIFAHPVNPNIHFRDIESVFSELGAELGHTGNGRLKVELNGHTGSFHSGEKTAPKEEVMQIRKFLEEAGVDAARDYPL